MCLRTASTINSRAVLLMAALGLAAFAVIGCRGQASTENQIQILDVVTGWFDAGIVDGKNKLVPTISLRLKNISPERIGGVQLNAVFRRVGEQEEWGSAFARAVGSQGLAPDAISPPIVLRSTLGYTGEQPRAQMLAHSDFRDARVQVFAKHGSAQWAKLGEFDIKRQLLTR